MKDVLHPSSRAELNGLFVGNWTERASQIRPARPLALCVLAATPENGQGGASPMAPGGTDDAARPCRVTACEKDWAGRYDTARPKSKKGAVTLTASMQPVRRVVWWPPGWRR